MRRVNVVTVSILLLMGAIHTTAVGRQLVPTPQQRPNIILLVTDDQRWDALGAYGNAVIQTPNIDRLAEEGVLFENMFVTTSICAPSRATIMTGQYPSRHGVRDFKTSLTREQLRQTYMGQLKDAGYRVGFIGKWGVGTSPKDFLDYDRTFPGQGQYFHDINGERRHLTGLMGDQTLEFLDQSDSEMPFMLSVSFKAAHVQDSYDVSGDLYQYDPALSDLYRDIDIPLPEKADPKYFDQLPAFLKNSENRARWAVRFWGPERAQESLKGYYRLISGVDQQVRRIRQKLEAKGLAENTVVIFTSENGMFMGEYGFTGKWYPHEESLRIPLIVHDPRRDASERGRRLDEMALTLDMAPTILDLAGVENRAAMQGRSLVSLLDGEKTSWRTEFFYEHLFEHPRIPATEAIRTERWKYIRYVDRVPVYEQLFDLKNDPSEVEDLMLVEGHEDVKSEMRRKWQEWHEKVRD
jgi:arylsulfatase A-like enzyme